MIARIRIVHADDSNKAIQPRGLFMISEITTLSDTFLEIKSGRFSCGQLWNLEKYDNGVLQCFDATKRTPTDYKDMMQAHDQVMIGGEI